MHASPNMAPGRLCVMLLLVCVAVHAAHATRVHQRHRPRSLGSYEAFLSPGADLETTRLDQQADDVVEQTMQNILSPPSSLLDTAAALRQDGNATLPAPPANSSAPAAAAEPEPAAAGNETSIEQLDEMVRSIIMRPIPGVNVTGEDSDSIDMPSSSAGAPAAGVSPLVDNELVVGNVSVPRMFDLHRPPNFTHFLRGQNLSNDSTPITESDRIKAYRALLKPNSNFPFPVELFNKFDLDHDGVLTYREFRALLHFANLTNLHLNDTAEQQSQGSPVDDPWTVKHYERYKRHTRSFWAWVEQHIAEQVAHNQLLGNVSFPHKANSEDAIFWRDVVVSPEEAGVGVTVPASTSVPIVESIPFVLTDAPEDNYTNPTITYEFFVNNISKSLANDSTFPIPYSLFQQFDLDGDGGLNYTEFQNIVSYVNLTNLRPTDDAVQQAQKGNIDEPWTQRHYKKYLVQVKAFRLWMWRHMYLQRVHNLAMTNSTFREEWRRARQAMREEAKAAQNTSQAFLNGPCSRVPSPCNDTQQCVTVSLPCDSPPCLSYKCVPLPTNPFAVSANGDPSVAAKPVDSLEVSVPLSLSFQGAPSASQGLLSSSSSSSSSPSGSGAGGAPGSGGSSTGGAAGSTRAGASGGSASGSGASGAAAGSAVSNASLANSTLSANGSALANATNATAGSATASGEKVLFVTKDAPPETNSTEPEPRWKILMRQMRPVEKVLQQEDLEERQRALDIMLERKSKENAKKAQEKAEQDKRDAAARRRLERRRARRMHPLPPPTIEQMKATQEWLRNQTLAMRTSDDPLVLRNISSILARHDNLTAPGRDLSLWFPNPRTPKQKPKELLEDTPAISWSGRVFNVSGDEDSLETTGRDTLPAWDYRNRGEDWPGVCKKGSQQSPVLLRDMTFPSDMYKDWSDRRLELKYWPASPSEVEVEFTGKSIMVKSRGKLGYVLDGPKRRRYDVLQVNFHTPSEHMADFAPLRTHGHFDAEMHIVHQQADSLFTRNVLIIAIFFQRPANATSETDGQNEWLENDLDWSQLPSREQPHPHIINHVVNLARATGPEAWQVPYFSYDGSLTVPPCTENVKWRILKSPLSISDQQLRRLSSLFAGNAAFANGNGNSRATQAFNYENRNIILM